MKNGIKCLLTNKESVDPQGCCGIQWVDSHRSLIHLRDKNPKKFKNYVCKQKKKLHFISTRIFQHHIDRLELEELDQVIDARKQDDEDDEQKGQKQEEEES